MRHDNWDSQVVWGGLKYRNAGLWTDQNGRQFNPKQHYYVGGNTKVYGAVLFRFRERDFGANRSRSRPTSRSRSAARASAARCGPSLGTPISGT